MPPLSGWMPTSVMWLTPVMAGPEIGELLDLIEVHKGRAGVHAAQASASLRRAAPSAIACT